MDKIGRAWFNKAAHNVIHAPVKTAMPSHQARKLGPPRRTQAGRSPAAEQDIGKRLRELREGLGLSQRALAARAGVTNGLISLIEKNRSSPSVATLKKILDGFPMSLSEFFGAGQPSRQQIFFTAGELVELGGGLLSYRQVGASLRDQAIQLLHERMEPGADTGPGLFRHDAEEGGVIIRGAVELSVGAETRVLRAGDAYYFDSRIPHRFRNVGGEVCEIVSACTPPSF
jgi:transcriptional regulator with XRE-family HTH domain